MRLILVRHGQSTWNAEGRLQGLADPPLSTAGRAQCARLRPLVAALRPDVMVASDLARARETAAVLAPGAMPDPRWREVDLGAWTGRRLVELSARERAGLERWRRGLRSPPAGESWDAARDRVADAVDALAHGGARRALVIAHGGAIRAACTLLCGSDLAHLAGVPNASFSVIDTLPRPRLRAYGVAPSGGA